MTRLEARLVDFELVRWPDGRDRFYRFRFGRCDDFGEALEQFKACVTLAERRPQPDNRWLWEVDATPANRRELAVLFDNFEAEYETAASQLRMFG